jgi:adenosylcobinamide amidohydrolase
VAVRFAKKNKFYRLNFFFSGSASIDLNADADLYIQSTNQRVGTINIAVTADITLSTTGKFLHL